MKPDVVEHHPSALRVVAVLAATTSALTFAGFRSGLVTARTTNQSTMPPEQGPPAEYRVGPPMGNVAGRVQVEAIVEDGRLSDVRVLQFPDGNPRSRQINAVALPLLRQQALATNGALLAGVSGATLTTDGYRRSLEAALETDGSPQAP